MNTIILASASRIKLNVVQNVISTLGSAGEFEIIPVALEKEGREPNGEVELENQLSSALSECRKQYPDASYYIAMEGGVLERKDGLHELAMVLGSKGKDANTVRSDAVSFPIPEKIAVKVRAGMPFAQAVEAVTRVFGIKEGGGFIGMLTNNIVTKEDLYFQPASVVLSRLFRDDDLYEK